MSIHPGLSGQEFIPVSLDRIAELRRLLPDEVAVRADGGITSATSLPSTEPAPASSSPDSAGVLGRRSGRRLPRLVKAAEATSGTSKGV